VISALLEDHLSYFVDGVTINGVSGGPAIHLTEMGVSIIGVVSAYAPNRATGETLPGLGIVRDVSQFHEELARFTSLESAQAEQNQNIETPSPTTAINTSTIR
jgi:secreted trypsin-like serine protease